MNPSLTSEWPIKHRADACARTERPFQPGEPFYTLLFREGDGFRREDLSEEAWNQRNDNIQPFSFWKSRYEPPPPTPPEPLAKENAEDLLRRLLAENNPANANASYVLAVMLERKRVLKPVKTQDTAGRPVLIYEHAKNGDVFIVPDVKLRLDQLEHVQNEVAELLNKTTPS
ncbi:MAG TPA: hypothetical protein VH252_06920 [Chthoniobacterales bacterium]|nr:hypothetical protein [Chthoniobacterales bacterium]